MAVSKDGQQPFRDAKGLRFSSPLTLRHGRPQTLCQRHYSFAALQNAGVFVVATCFSREPRHDTNETR